LHQEEASFALYNDRPEPVPCPDRTCICYACRALRPCSYEGSRLDCYHFIVVENGVWIVFAPGVITYCDAAFKTIDWFSASRTWHVAIILAANPYPHPHDDGLYKYSL
jgi:hypothetical protein